MSMFDAAYRYITGRSPGTETNRAARIREIEKAAGSGRAAARRVGISDSSWRRYKSGQTTPTATTEGKLSAVMRSIRLPAGREKNLRKTIPPIIADITIRVSDDERERKGLNLTKLGCVSMVDWHNVINAYFGDDLAGAVATLIDNAVEEYVAGAEVISVHNVKIGEKRGIS